MDQIRSDPPHERRSNLPVILTAVAVIGAAQAAAWFYFRSRQPVTDEITRERLQPRGAK